MLMKFVGFNLKEPKVNNNYGNVLDDLYDILIKEISLMNERTEELLWHIK